MQLFLTSTHGNWSTWEKPVGYIPPYNSNDCNESAKVRQAIQSS